MAMRRFDRLPRLWYLHRLLVQQPTLSYLLGIVMIPALFGGAVAAWLLGRSVLGLCLAVLSVALPLLWRRDSEADSADHLATLLAVTGVAILAGTQVFFLKDFLQGDAYYRMNTLFKFFNQVWVLWAIAGAIALPRLWSAAGQMRAPSAAIPEYEAHATTIDPLGSAGAAPVWRGWSVLWRLASVLLLATSSVYLVFGTPSRLSQRFAGWVPPFGTLDGMAFMEQGRYAWPNDSNWIDLSFDYDAVQWLLANVRGNLVIAESAEVDYYRAGGTRVASMTGLSGLRGPHVSEQRYGDQVGARDGLHREFWATGDVARTQQLIDQLQVALIYVSQLERYHHPEGVQKLAKMASEGRLEVLYQNEGVVIYAVPGRIQQTEGGWYVPVPIPGPLPLPLPSMGTQPSLYDYIPEPS